MNRSLLILAFTGAVLLLAMMGAAQAGINVWTGGSRYSYPYPFAHEGLAIVPGRPGALYGWGAATDDGAVYMSTDGGSTWDSTEIPDQTWALAVDPSAPDTVYLGTGGYSGQRGVLKSTDAGASWNPIGETLRSAVHIGVFALAIEPHTPTTIYAGTDVGVFKSIDAGETWDATNTGRPSDTGVWRLVIDPVTPTTLYAGDGQGTRNVGHALHKSIDAGATWIPADAGLPTNTWVTALVIDPLTPSTLYAAKFGGRVFKSTDAGATWKVLDTQLTSSNYVALAIDPTMPSTLYTGSDGVFQSIDGGGNWHPFINTGQKFSGVFQLAIDPLEPTTLYAATDNGVFSIQQVAAVCAGDCTGTHAVTISDVITLVNIDLGSAEPAACAGGGLPLGGEVDVAVIIEAVSNALSGCDD